MSMDVINVKTTYQLQLVKYMESKCHTYLQTSCKHDPQVEPLTAVTTRIAKSGASAAEEEAKRFIILPGIFPSVDNVYRVRMENFDRTFWPFQAGFTGLREYDWTSEQTRDL